MVQAFPILTRICEQHRVGRLGDPCLCEAGPHLGPLLMTHRFDHCGHGAPSARDFGPWLLRRHSNQAFCSIAGERQLHTIHHRCQLHLASKAGSVCEGVSRLQHVHLTHSWLRQSLVEGFLQYHVASRTLKLLATCCMNVHSVLLGHIHDGFPNACLDGQSSPALIRVNEVHSHCLGLHCRKPICGPYSSAATAAAAAAAGIFPRCRKPLPP
mmetsp:Transcript_95560/g.240804  ORF Transcript_95560/g.240804 Transcript_95560/m.240804 type:complete len:212 (-) Transcript_95560:526-1161(-)